MDRDCDRSGDGLGSILLIIPGCYSDTYDVTVASCPSRSKRLDVWVSSLEIDSYRLVLRQVWELCECSNRDLVTPQVPSVPVGQPSSYLFCLLPLKISSLSLCLLVFPALCSECCISGYVCPTILAIERVQKSGSL